MGFRGLHLLGLVPRSLIRVMGTGEHYGKGVIANRAGVPSGQGKP